MMAFDIPVATLVQRVCGHYTKSISFTIQKIQAVLCLLYASSAHGCAGAKRRYTMAVQFVRSDLEFILTQIEIAERNAAGESLLDLLANVTLPFGLRTVDGSLNNIVPTQKIGRASCR